MSQRITAISSMATRAVLAEMADAYRQAGGAEVVIESVGGVDASRRVQAGEAFDVVVLASDAIDRLAGVGAVVAGSKVDLVLSGVAIAVRAGAPRPDVSSEAALRQAVLAARSIGYSTGPSGAQLLKLFDRWDITEALQGRLVQAPPGVPVGTLVARGEVELGFHQRSELMHVDGITLLGAMPAPAQIDTTFSAARCTGSTQEQAVHALLEYMGSLQTAEIKRRHGMAPA